VQKEGEMQSISRHYTATSSKQDEHLSKTILQWLYGTVALAKKDQRSQKQNHSCQSQIHRQGQTNTQLSHAMSSCHKQLIAVKASA
jgi:hypothetical protein